MEGTGWLGRGGGRFGKERRGADVGSQLNDEDRVAAGGALLIERKQFTKQDERSVMDFGSRKRADPFGGVTRERRGQGASSQLRLEEKRRRPPSSLGPKNFEGAYRAVS